MKKRAFTLVEIIIVVILFWLLSWVILKVYTTITQVSFRIGQDKQLAKESLVLEQVLDNIAQTATIDYDKYKKQVEGIPGADVLIDNKGITDVLYLTWWNWTGTSISSTWDCAETTILEDLEKYEEFLSWTKNKEGYIPCQLILSKEWEEPIILLGDWGFQVSNVTFKIIPYLSSVEIIDRLWKEGADLSKIPPQWKPGFWILWAVYSEFYHPKKWATNSIIPIQFFYGLKWATKSIYDLD